MVQPRDPSGRFLNLDGSIPNDLSSVLRWAVVDSIAGRRRKSPRRAAVPQVSTDPSLLREPPASGQPARLTWLGHASWLVQLDGVSLLIDPYLSDRGPGLARRNAAVPVRIEDLPRIDAQLVSHNHYDHMDVPTLVGVRSEVIAGLGMKPSLTAAGLQCTELGWWDKVEIGAVTVTFVPSQHWSRRGAFDGNRTLWGGFVIQGSATLYHAGDTATFQGFQEIGRRFPGIDAAMLPIGAYDPAWFMERQHMNPEQAVQAFVDVGARHFLAMHWGTFKLTDEPLDEPPIRLQAEWERRGWDRTRLQIPAVGETVSIYPQA